MSLDAEGTQQRACALDPRQSGRGGRMAQEAWPAALLLTRAVLPGKSPWTEEPGWQQSVESERVKSDFSD